MFGGAVSLIAKIGIPLVASAIKSIVDSSSQSQQSMPVTAKPSAEQVLAAQFDVSDLSVNEMKQLANSLYNSGKLTVEEYGILTSMPLDIVNNESGGIELVAHQGKNNNQPIDFIKNLERSIQARLDNGIRQGTEASISLLNKLNTLKAMHHIPVATQA